MTGPSRRARPFRHKLEDLALGLLVDGVWHDTWYDTKSSGGAFKRSTAGFRNWITADGSAGPTGGGEFKAEVGRYHLYVSHACPWAHRTLIFRKLKGLEDIIDVSAVHPDMLSDGWTFERDAHGATRSALQQAEQDLDARREECHTQATAVAQRDEQLAAAEATRQQEKHHFTALIAEKDRRVAEQATSIRDVTAALKRAQSAQRKSS